MFQGTLIPEDVIRTRLTGGRKEVNTAFPHAPVLRVSPNLQRPLF